MNKSQVKEMLYSLCPGIPVLRKALSGREIKKYTRMLFPESVVARAELNSQERDSMLAKAKDQWPNRYRSDYERISRIFEVAPDYQNLDKARQEALRKDMLFCRFAYGFMPEEYLCYRLDQKSQEKKKSFISESDHMVFCYRMNDPVDINIFNDKMRTYHRFGKYYHREIISVSSRHGYDRYSRYVKAHPVFVKKQVFESCGNSIEKIDINSCGKTERELYASFLEQGKVVLEELVEQSEATSIFNDSSVNTIRCITVNTKNGVLVPYCFMKVGRKGAFVDNGGAGGILVGIDKDTGMTNTDGYDEMRRIYKQHPDSGVTFTGHQLPEWNRLISICKEMASQMNSVKFIGWDLAHTKKDGWVVIEGNGMSQFIGPQTVWQRGIKKEVERFITDL